MSKVSTSINPPARHLVIGGAGFLGSHIVEGLKARSEEVAVFDLLNASSEHRVADVQYFAGDIVDESRLTETLKQCQPDVVHHTLSPIYGLPPPIYHKYS